MANQEQDLQRALDEERRARTEADRRLTALSEHLPVAIVIEDASRKTVLANAEFRRLFAPDANSDDPLGQTGTQVDEIIAAAIENRNGFIERVQDILRAQDPISGERILLRDGRILERDFFPIQEEGDHRGHVWKYRDITQEERPRQELLKATREAEAANRAKAHFLATMSHEMRTPLSAITGMSDLLVRSRLSEDQRSYVERVQANADTLLHLIEDILEFSKLEAGQIRLQESPFDPLEVVEDVGELMASRAHAKDLELITLVEPHLPASVLGDAHRLRQLLVNLIGNAIKFTDRGEVCIRARPTRIDKRTFELVYEVVDTGVGIPPDMQERVFQRFARVEHPAHARIPGTGLGLSICRSLVDLMHGTLELESQEGKGTRFTLRLPHGEGLSATERPWPSHDLAESRVLLIEDNHTARRALERLLSTWGAQVTGASSVADALRNVQERPPDVIVADEGTLGPLGSTTRRRLASPFGWHLVPQVILRTVESDPFPVSDRLIAVAKPVRQRALYVALSRALGLRTSALDPAGGDTGTLLVSDSYRALLAEDDPDNRAMLQRMLERRGFLVDAVADGAAALERARDYAYDLVVTDIAMPVLDGEGFVRGLRTHERENNRPRVPVIAVTAHALPSYRERALSAGMDAYLTKPCSMKALRSAIEGLLDPRAVVLVADDQPDSRALLRAYLSERSDIRLLFARNGIEVLNHVNQGRVSLVLMDMMMPQLDGYEAARRLLARADRPRVPVVALTAHCGPEAKERCLAAGCIDYLSKPVRREALSRILDQYLSNERDPSAPRVIVDPDVADLVPGYLENRAQDLEQLRELLARGEFEPIGHIGHNLKGSGAGYGFDRLTELGAALEDAARTRSGAGVDATLGELETFLECVVIEVADHHP